MDSSERVRLSRLNAAAPPRRISRVAAARSARSPGRPSPKAAPPRSSSPPTSRTPTATRSPTARRPRTRTSSWGSHRSSWPPIPDQTQEPIQVPVMHRGACLRDSFSCRVRPRLCDRELAAAGGVRRNGSCRRSGPVQQPPLRIVAPQPPGPVEDGHSSVLVLVDHHLGTSYRFRVVAEYIISGSAATIWMTSSEVSRPVPELQRDGAVIREA